MQTFKRSIAVKEGGGVGRGQGGKGARGQGGKGARGQGGKEGEGGDIQLIARYASVT